MTIDVKKGAVCAALAATLIAAMPVAVGPAHADVLSEMRNFWRGAAVNTTGPTAFQGQASGHWTLGNLYLRAPVRSEQIATVSLPSFRAGCGGIDAFAGAFSFINSDQLIAFGRAVAQNAAGFAFELALETISPVIAETMAKLRALAQWVNDRNLNSCETAQALVGAVWSKNDRASAAICAAIGTSQGIFSDYAAAKHGCNLNANQVFRWRRLFREPERAAGTGRYVPVVVRGGYQTPRPVRGRCAHHPRTSRWRVRRRRAGLRSCWRASAG